LNFDFSEQSEEILACLNYSCFDIDKGLLLKLGEDREVLAAFKGRVKLTKEKIKSIYGSPPIFDFIQWPKMRSFVDADGPNYWTFNSYLEHSKCASVMMGVEIIDKGNTNPKKTYQDLSKDMWKTEMRCYIT